jgi:hypothetical protein
MLKKPNLPQSKLLAELLAKKTGETVTYIGYIGPEEGPDQVVLYQDLEDLSKCVSIKTNDIVHYVAAPESLLPFGGVILWLKKDSDVTPNAPAETTVAAQPAAQAQPENGVQEEISESRLEITVKRASFAVRAPQPCRSK